jgi:glycosyltransferase involved in cell wall biosynthesis
LVGKKTAVTVQGLDWQRKKWSTFASAILRLGEVGAVRMPNATMVVSRQLHSYYRQQHHAETFYVANGAIARQQKPSSRLAGWGLTPEQYILFLGRFSPEKNCHLLIDAYQRSSPAAKLVLAGGGRALDPYQINLRKNASDRILFLDYVSGEAFDELLTNAMLFVLPSDLEGLSLALLEAMAAGLCVLTSDIPENLELVENAGFTFRRGDQPDLERMLLRLIADPRLRQDSGRRARERVRAQYKWEEITRDIERVYFHMMGIEATETKKTPTAVIDSPTAATNAGRVA